MDLPDPSRVIVNGRPWWRFDDGTMLPVVSGGAEGDPAGDGTDDGDGSDESGGDDTSGEAFDEARAKAKITKANAEAAGLRKRLKEAEAKASRLDELENQGKSETERLSGEAANATTRAEKAELEAARWRVALEKGLTQTMAKRLVGTTEEELSADADELVSELGNGTSGNGTSNGLKRKPDERLKGGGAPEEEPEESDPWKLAEKIPRSRF
jgi:hypothetical protein